LLLSLLHRPLFQPTSDLKPEDPARENGARQVGSAAFFIEARVLVCITKHGNAKIIA
jgi:hypothetical protein